MENVEGARRRWVQERAQYDRFAAYLKASLQSVVKNLGLSGEVHSRTKDVDSLVKKLILKRHHTYESLPDKVGARIVIRYLHELPEVRDVVQKMWDCSLPDDKRTSLGHEKVGYQGIHLDIKLRQDDDLASTYPPDLFMAEVQIRTFSQHVWSEMSHDTVYKGGEFLSTELKRRIHLQAALMELADMEFSRVMQETAGDPRMSAVMAMHDLEKRYYRLTSRKYDPELTLRVLDLLLPLYASETDLVAKVDDYLSGHSSDLEHVFNEQAELEQTRSAFMFQPEVIALAERLSNDQWRLKKLFAENFGLAELELVANALGQSFD
jgi:putative GTP pyrophosphokinase